MGYFIHAYFAPLFQFDLPRDLYHIYVYKKNEFTYLGKHDVSGHCKTKFKRTYVDIMWDYIPRCPAVQQSTGHCIQFKFMSLYSERPRGAEFRSVNPAERWRENPARALVRAGFSQHLECGIHRSESSPEGSFALIPHPVARWARSTP